MTTTSRLEDKCSHRLRNAYVASCHAVKTKHRGNMHHHCQANEEEDVFILNRHYFVYISPYQ